MKNFLAKSVGLVAGVIGFIVGMYVVKTIFALIF